MALKPKLANAVTTAQEFNMRKPPPSTEQISFLVPEDFVKLKCNGEYFWAKVDATDNPCIGIVLDEPVFSQIYQKGDRIEFKGENIFDMRSYKWKTNEGL